MGGDGDLLKRKKEDEKKSIKAIIKFPPVERGKGGTAFLDIKGEDKIHVKPGVGHAEKRKLCNFSTKLRKNKFKGTKHCFLLLPLLLFIL